MGRNIGVSGGVGVRANLIENNSFSMGMRLSVSVTDSACGGVQAGVSAGESSFESDDEIMFVCV